MGAVATARMSTQSEDNMSGKRSVIPPGWMPEPCSTTPAAAQMASSSDTSREANG